MRQHKVRFYTTDEPAIHFDRITLNDRMQSNLYKKKHNLVTDFNVYKYFLLLQN